MYIVLIVDIEDKKIILEKYCTSINSLFIEYRKYTTDILHENELDKYTYAFDMFSSNNYIITFKLCDLDKLKLVAINPYVKPYIDLFRRSYTIKSLLL
jgi:hypothetical protein